MPAPTCLLLIARTADTPVIATSQDAWTTAQTNSAPTPSYESCTNELPPRTNEPEPRRTRGTHERILRAGMNEPEARPPRCEFHERTHSRDKRTQEPLPRLRRAHPPPGCSTSTAPPPSPRPRFAHDGTNPANPRIFHETCFRTNPRSMQRNEPGDPMKGEMHERIPSQHKRTREPLPRPVRPHPTAPLVAGPPFLPY
jgi:hypothetical protein